MPAMKYGEYGAIAHTESRSLLDFSATTPATVHRPQKSTQRRT